MKAVVYYEFGSADVLRVEEVERPAPAHGEVLIAVRAASVNPLDWRLMSGLTPVLRAAFRMRRPTPANPGRPGRDVAGRVEEIGAGVTRFKPGDEVFGWCQGALAEYACAAESALVAKPASVTFEQAGSVAIAALTALQGLRDVGRLRSGQSVLVNGAAGGVGTFAVQIAKALGAHVTGVCSTGNVEMVRSIGADRVIDYTRADVTRIGDRFDVILDNVGNLSLASCRRLLAPGGRCAIAGAPKQVQVFLARALAAPVVSLFGSRKIGAFMAKLDREDLAALSDLMAAGKVTPVIDRCVPLAEARDAVRHAEAGHARGKVVITVGA